MVLVNFRVPVLRVLLNETVFPALDTFLIERVVPDCSSESSSLLVTSNKSASASLNFSVTLNDAPTGTSFISTEPVPSLRVIVFSSSSPPAIWYVKVTSFELSLGRTLSMVFLSFTVVVLRVLVNLTV